MNTIVDVNLAAYASARARGPFIIVSRAKSRDGRYLAIAAGDDGLAVVNTMKPRDTLQRWYKEPLFPGSRAYALVNFASNTCITRDSEAQGSRLVLVDYVPGKVEDLAMWRNDSAGEMTAIHSALARRQTISIPDHSGLSGTQLITSEMSTSPGHGEWQFMPAD